MKTIIWASEVAKDDIPQVGGKGANLGEMTKAGMPIPPAFMVSADAFAVFIEKTGIKEEIFKILGSINLDDKNDLKNKAAQARELFYDKKIPWDMEMEIVKAYKQMSEKGGVESELVAVRSSATAEDLPEASFAGQQETYLNIIGKEMLLDRVKRCWASLYTARAIFYRIENGFKHEDVKLSVVVQKMVNSEVSGVMFTSDPSTGAPRVIVEAVYGLGEAIVGGEVTPDTYLVNQEGLELVDKRISKQTWQYVRGSEGETVKANIEAEAQESQKLLDSEIREISKIGVDIEKHYGKPMDVEWCIEEDKIYVVQARPVTTIKKQEPGAAEKKAAAAPSPAQAAAPEPAAKASASASSPSSDPILKGLAASPGLVGGKVTMIYDPEELDKVKPGDIMVTVMTSPDMVPAMKIAGGIVTDEGGTTCHAAIVSRELGIPCIVGTGEATKKLSDGMEVTVDANVGVVYEGISKKAEEAKAAAAPGAVLAAGGGAVFADSVPVTGTKVLMNIGVPEMAEKYAKLPVQGVGLMREEFIVTSYVKAHPNFLIKEGRGQEYIDKLAEGFATVARAFYPRPVVLRTSDFKTNEYKDLEGGAEYEGQENNPMIGWRGCSRYVSPNFEEAFRLECRAIKKVREELGLKNLWAMLPFVRLPEEAEQVIAIMAEEGLKRGKDFKIWFMAEVPSNIFAADKFGELCDGFSIGSNDLCQLVMGADRDSDVLQQMGYFDERNLPVLRAIEHLIEVAHEKGCTVSICGQAPSVYPEFTEFLVRNGIDSISVNNDVVVDTIKLVARVEKKIMLERLKDLAER